MARWTFMDVHAVYTVHTIHIVYTVYTVYTIQTLYSRIPGIQDFKTSELGTSRMPTAELLKNGDSGLSEIEFLENPKS
jgi:hypothetical protein